MDVISTVGLSQMARLAGGIKPQSVSDWRKGGIPIDRCTEIERNSEGKYPCEVLRADVVWVRQPDPAWPWHPNGRPLHDVAATRQRALDAESQSAGVA